MKFVLVLVIVLLLYTLFVSYSVYRKVLDNNYKSLETAIETTADTISQTLDMTRGITYALSGSESVVNWRSDKEYFVGNDKWASLNRQKLNEEMQQVLAYNNTWKFNLFDYITIYENDRLLAISYTKQFSTQQIINDTSKIQKELSVDEKYTQILPPKDGNSSIYTTLRIQADFQSDDSLYVIGVTGTEGFDKKLKCLVNHKGTAAYVMRTDGTVFAASDEEKLGKNLGDTIVSTGKGLEETNIGGRNYQIIKWKINNEFYLVYLLPKVEMMKQTLVDMRMLLLLSIITAIVLIIPATIVIVNMTTIFKDLIDAMRRVGDKDYEVRLHHYSNAAYDEVAVNFNSMVEKLKELIQITYESKILLKEMEIKSLQQQMNPHFLFNILLTIQIKAKMSGDETVYKMISSLSSLLRAGIYGDKRTIITIREEMKYVKYYLSLQQERYEERLKYQIEVEDESILDCEIPRLVVEPMVENTIVHGVEAVDGNLEVNVRLRYDGDHILITVKDNGVGFNVEELNMKKSKTIDGEVRHEKTGISNTHQRIRLMYGEPYGIQIFSQPMKGTEVLICIPKNSSKRDEKC
ncbi:sensor histidine kinase [Roseburia hominis]